MKKILVITMLLFIIASAGSVNLSQRMEGSAFSQMDLSPEEMEIVRTIGEERFAREGIANVAYDRMLNSFSSDPLTNGDDYPEYYGGAFADDEGYLVINVTDDSEEVLAELTARTGLSVIKVQKVKYSFAELGRITRELRESVSNAELAIRNKVVGYGMDQKRGLVRVYVKNASKEDEYAIRTMSSAPDAIIFVASSGHMVEDTDVKAGSEYRNATGVYRVSGYYNGQSVVGIMTAGHAVPLNQYIYTTNNVPFAKCIQKGYGGSMDAAFCMITNSNYIPSNYIENSDYLLSTATLNPLEGTTIFKQGKTTGLTAGTIIDTQGSYELDNVVWSNLTYASYASAVHDSGGIVYRFASGTRYTVGIHRGRWVEDGENMAVFVKASIQNYVLGVLRY